VQRKVVDHPGPVVKLLGPAAGGKTTALARALRAADRRRGRIPRASLIFVRDRRQAIALRDLLVRRLGRSVAGPSVLTFHAFAWSLLGRVFGGEDSSGPTADVGYELAGYESEPILLTAFDQRAFVRELLDEEDPAEWPVNGGLARLQLLRR
jgi:superfamily I DNA/RNA helicase